MSSRYISRNHIQSRAALVFLGSRNSIIPFLCNNSNISDVSTGYVPYDDDNMMQLSDAGGVPAPTAFHLDWFLERDISEL
ncbi:hypothetical protein M8C21_032426 [Ambrosia artemisiifolia]|uniref:Uncharacterized protein n=1 Tax=Ambrosia artemisiifolia TaxID=4212 RepID=A0AAD5BPH0_AMBAR|nr:hypothetical protein M8C21_032426 [Ambrosia artemisiifolia]